MLINLYQMLFVQQKEIILIDNFIDDTVLSLFAKRNKDIKVTIYCKKITQELLLDLKNLTCSIHR